jgi:hypothetical protein
MQSRSRTERSSDINFRGFGHNLEEQAIIDWFLVLIISLYTFAALEPLLSLRGRSLALFYISFPPILIYSLGYNLSLCRLLQRLAE